MTFLIIMIINACVLLQCYLPLVSVSLQEVNKVKMFVKSLIASGMLLVMLLHFVCIIAIDTSIV